MTKTIELTLEKECDLKPGKYNLLKVDGKKLTIEASVDISEDNSEKQRIMEELSLVDEVFQKFEQDKDKIPMRTFAENIAGYKGGLFKTAKDVDDYIRKERDSWDS